MNMKKLLSKLSHIALIAIFMTLQSCEVEYLEADLPVESAAQQETRSNQKLLQNPYEIQTFRKAYQKILDSVDTGSYKAGKAYDQDKSVNRKAEDIKPNYLYIKFSPKTDEQEFILQQHPKIVFVDYPFEYEDGESFHRQHPLKEGERLSFYASIPMSAAYPKNIPHKILQEMYIPEEDEAYNKVIASDKQTLRGFVDDRVDFMNHVIEQAYTDTNNTDLLPEPPSTKDNEGCETCFLGINLRSKWRPSGNVQIYDDNMGTSTYTVTECRTYYTYDYSPCYRGDYAHCPRRIARRTCNNVVKERPGSYVPIDGANILIRDTWTLDRAIADAHGNFRHKEVRARVRYVIKWDRFEFSIRDNSGLTQAEDKGPRLYNQPWNLRITGGRMKYRGQIFQAAMHFYYHNIGGLTRPPTNGFWKKQMKITAKEIDDTSFHAPEQGTAGAVLGFFSGNTIGGVLGRALTSTIRISAYGRSSEVVYGKTIHELAHAAHWRFDRNSYDALVEDAWIEPFLGGNFNNPSTQNRDARRTLETWATGVEVYLTRIRYRRLGPSDYEYQTRNNDLRTGNYQSEDINGERSQFYTSAVWDLIDDFNQREEFGYPRPIDNVRGFTMPKLEMNMRGSRSWNQFRNKILTEDKQQKQVIELFANWN